MNYFHRADYEYADVEHFLRTGEPPAREGGDGADPAGPARS
jgi:hypothetical protein